MYASVFFHLCSFDSLRFASPRLALSCLSFLFVFSFRLSGIFFSLAHPADSGSNKSSRSETNT